MSIDTPGAGGGPGAQPEAGTLVEAARAAARQGHPEQARRLLHAAIRQDAACAEAWLGLAWLAPTLREREALLHRVLALAPGHAKARAELTRLARRRRRWGWAGALLGLLALLALAAFLAWGPLRPSLAWLLPTPVPTAPPTPTDAPSQVAARFVPQLQAALEDENWDRALDLVAILNSLDPGGEQVREWSLSTYMQTGRALVAQDEAGRALPLFEQAAELAPQDGEPSRWQDTTRDYLAGREALAAREWSAAVERFAAVESALPGYGDAASRLVQAYRLQGEAALEAQEWALAVDSLTQALERSSGDAELAALLSQAYRLQAQAALDAKEWDQAIDTLTQARERLPGDEQVVDLLARAYVQRGAFREQGDKLKEARADLEAALALRPDDAEAKAHLKEVMLRLFPPKRIEIDISQQRMYVYQGGKLLWQFVVSTGLPGRDTAVGHYKVLDKIPMAYSAIWRLKMPNWLGIYYVGRIENGIHALPIRPDGTVMWGGLLGTKQSYGCVILNNEAARTLYNWAEVGTPVDIHY